MPANDIDTRVADLETEIQQLKLSLRRLQGMNATLTGRELLREGTFVFPDSAAELTETAGIGRYQANVYVSGSTIRLQCFDFDASAWREATLS